MVESTDPNTVNQPSAEGPVYGLRDASGSLTFITTGPPSALEATPADLAQVFARPTALRSHRPRLLVLPTGPAVDAELIPVAA